MKKLVLAVIVAATSLTGFAQTTSEIDLMQSVFGLEKLEVVTAYVKPGAEYKDAFIKLYDEYEVKRKEFGKERITLITEYAEKWDGMTNEQADEWMKKVLALSTKRDKLIRTYYSKVKKATNAKIATQFYQVEVYILTEIRSAVFETIPFVDEGK